MRKRPTKESYSPQKRPAADIHSHIPQETLSMAEDENEWAIQEKTREIGVAQQRNEVVEGKLADM